MREIGFIVLNYVGFTLMTVLLASFQSSLWLQLFGYTPPPYMWIAIVNYWVMFRRPGRAMIMTYIAAYALFAMTGMPLNILFSILIINFAILYFIRDRVFWTGPTHFMLACGGSAFLLPLSTAISCVIFEAHPFVEFRFFSWIISALFTALSALPIYYVLVFIDRLTFQDAPRDTSSEII